QGDASSTEAFFSYQTATCGGPRPSIFNVPRASGFSLMSTNPASDYSLVIIDGSIPSSQVVWAGWTSAVQGSGVDTIAVHHPSGDVKKISFGTTDFSLNCSGFGIPTIPNFWTGQGVTEPGSSGSGLFRDDGNQQLIGQLFGGPSFCGVSDSGRFDCYGPFSTTYQRIKTLIAGGSDDKSEQNDTCAKARVLKKGTQSGRILKLNDPDWYKFSVPAHKTVTISLAFFNQFGDVDLETFAKCGDSPIVVSNGTDDGEAVSITNVGSKPAWLYIHPYFGDEDTRAIYNISVQ
ncbi:MAG TPA: hypothetical protein VGV61_03955, partial [Thermoanaerobaculia bacterium]|nr:hypothetical protein [Thermoanaerobaculia bacterium]